MDAHFELSIVKQSVIDGNYRTTMQGIKWLTTHGYDAEKAISVILSLKPEELCKVYPPRGDSTSWADAYKTRYSDSKLEEELYVKFTMNGSDVVILLSCKEWGYGW